MDNFDDNTVESFGAEWKRFDQTNLRHEELQAIFEDYFDIVPAVAFNNESMVADIGCGSGRWASIIAPKVGKLICFEPSNALEIAKANLEKYKNVELKKSRVDELNDYFESFDFIYSLGVVHHIPDTPKAIVDCVKTVKPGGYCLFYIYYALDNRPFWFRGIWRLSNIIRKFVSTRSDLSKNLLCDLIAFTVYLPLKLINSIVNFFGIEFRNIPLSYYSDKSILTLRTDARDRFGTPLEQRFNKNQIQKMLVEAGLKEIKFSDKEPYWCVIGKK